MCLRKEHTIINGKESKQCSRCLGIKPIEEFYSYSNSWDKLTSSCKICERYGRRIIYSDNIEYERERNKKKIVTEQRKQYLEEWNKNNFQINKERSKAWVANNKERFNAIENKHFHKRRSLEKHLQFSYSEEQWMDCKEHFPTSVHIAEVVLICQKSIL